MKGSEKKKKINIRVHMYTLSLKTILVVSLGLKTFYWNRTKINLIVVHVRDIKRLKVLVSRVPDALRLQM